MRFRLRSVLVPCVAAALAVSACGGAESESSYTVGLVTNNANGLRNVAGFMDGMAEIGYVEGENVSYIFAGEPLAGAALEQTLDDMVRGGVDLIFTAGTPTGVAAFEATKDSRTPVVFGVIADPVRAGVMSDLTAPGGNMTGVKLDSDQSRRLELLLEMAGDVRRILVPFNPGDAAAASAVTQIQAIAADLGAELVLRETSTDDEVVSLLGDFPDTVDAIFLVPDSTVNAHLEEIVAVAAKAGIPTSGPSIAQVEGGALMAYGFVHHDAGFQAARIADQVLRGADPGALPVENTESYLAINLVTAERIGLSVSDQMLRRADILLRDEHGE